MDYSLQQLFQDVRNGNYEVLSANLNQNGHRIAALQRELHADSRLVDDKSLEVSIESQNFQFSGKSWTRFTMMLVSFLQYCRDVNPWSTWESCDLIFKFYQDLSNCLLNDNYPTDCLVPLFMEMTEYVVPISIELDVNYMALKTDKNQFVSHTSSIISKVFNSVKPSRSADDDDQERPTSSLPEKQRILLYLVNKLVNLYFRIQAPQLCSNIFKNFKPKSMASSFRTYPIKQQIEYRYLLGRYYLLNHRVTNAFVQLSTAFNELVSITSTTDAPQVGRNLSRILRYLVPAGLIMGKIPRFDFISVMDSELSSKYSVLYQCIRSGRISGLNHWLKNHERQLCEEHLLLLLLEKLPMICYRNLVKTVLLNFVIPQNTGKLPYATLETAMKLSIGDTHIKGIDIYSSIHSPANVENVLVTLINLGLLRGNCFPELSLCVVKKTQVICDILPLVQDRIVANFPLNPEDSWLDD